MRSYEKKTCMRDAERADREHVERLRPADQQLDAPRPSPPTSAAMLIVLATTSRPTSETVSQRGQMLADVGRQAVRAVTQPMRAESIWMPIISGVVRNSVQTRAKRNCAPACE